MTTRGNRMEVLIKDLPAGRAQAICTGINATRAPVCTWTDVFATRKNAFEAAKLHVTSEHVRFVYRKVAIDSSLIRAAADAS